MQQPSSQIITTSQDSPASPQVVAVVRRESLAIQPSKTDDNERAASAAGPSPTIATTPPVQDSPASPQVESVVRRESLQPSTKTDDNERAANYRVNTSATEQGKGVDESTLGRLRSKLVNEQQQKRQQLQGPHSSCGGWGSRRSRSSRNNATDCEGDARAQPRHRPNPPQEECGSGDPHGSGPESDGDHF